MKLRQYELYEKDTQSHLVCWLDANERLKEGSIITLKDIPERKWVVRKYWGMVLQTDDLKRGWKVDI